MGREKGAVTCLHFVDCLLHFSRGGEVYALLDYAIAVVEHLLAKVRGNDVESHRFPMSA